MTKKSGLFRPGLSSAEWNRILIERKEKKDKRIPVL